MINANSVEHFDNFGDSIIFWCVAEDIPSKYVKEAKKIDEDNYSEDCFGCCVILDSDGWHMCQDEINCELYYVDNDGDKHWMNKVFSDKEKKQFTDMCFEIVTESVSE